LIDFDLMIQKLPGGEAKYKHRNKHQERPAAAYYHRHLGNSDFFSGSAA